MSDELLKAFREASRVGPGEVDGLLASLASEIDAASARAGEPGEEPNVVTLHAAPPAGPVRATAPSPVRWWMPLGIGGAAAIGLAAAAALLLTLHSPSEPTPQPDSPVALRLDAEASSARIQVGAGTWLDYSGQGSVGGTAQRPLVEWERGRVRVEVDPDAGIDLVVHTREGEVRVLGTIFHVDRSALGTEVTVERGKVAVTCEGAPEQQLTIGLSATCLPTTAGGLLGRAHALRDATADPALVVGTLERGLELAEPGAVRNELRVLRMVVLSELGRVGPALDEAQAYLAEGQAQRRDEVHELAVGLAVGIADCEAARPALDALAPEADPRISTRIQECRDGAMR